MKVGPDAAPEIQPQDNLPLPIPLEISAITSSVLPVDNTDLVPIANPVTNPDSNPTVNNEQDTQSNGSKSVASDDDDESESEDSEDEEMSVDEDHVEYLWAGRQVGERIPTTERQDQAILDVMAILDQSAGTRFWADKRGKENFQTFLALLFQDQGTVALAAQKNLLTSFRVASLIHDPQAGSS